jgi:hypothetical protein
VELKLNRTNHLLDNADHAKILGDNMCIVRKNTETIIDASKEVDLEIKKEDTMYMLLSCHQDMNQNHDMKITNRLFENVTVQIFESGRY